MLLVIGEVRGLAVHRRRGGDNHAVDAVFSGGFEDVDGAVDVVLVDCFRLLDALANARLCGLVIDDVAVFDELRDCGFVRDRPLYEGV